MTTGKQLSNDITRIELMRALETVISLGSNIHICHRKQLPSRYSVADVEIGKWEAFRKVIEERYDWSPENRLTWNRQHTDGSRTLEYVLHLDNGVTIERTHDGEVELLYDSENDEEVVNLLKERMDQLTDPESNNEIGFIQSAYGGLTVKFCRFKAYRHNMIPFMGEEIQTFYNRMMEQFRSNSENGLYLLHGAPGTGKTSFIKQVLSQVDKKALFITPAFTEQLTSPELIGLLMDYPDSILVIEDAETVLMKRDSDNSSAVSNLLNLSDGFPADFLNLNILCTFNTKLDNIDPALLREGRLKGVQEFTKLSPGQARRVADGIGVDISVTEPMTIAEICNGKQHHSAFKSKRVGFGG